MDLVVYAMERSETEEKFDDGGTSQLLWQHLSSQLIFFVLFQFASFPHMVLSLHQKVSARPLSEPFHLLMSLFQTSVSSETEVPSSDFSFVQCSYDFFTFHFFVTVKTGFIYLFHIFTMPGPGDTK